MTRLLSVTEAAERLHVHPATIRRMIARGEISAKRVGRVWRVDPSDLEPERRELVGSHTTSARVVTSSRFSGIVRLPLARKGSPAS